jgi:hypothetical protein
VKERVGYQQIEPRPAFVAPIALARGDRGEIVGSGIQPLGRSVADDLDDRVHPVEPKR